MRAIQSSDSNTATNLIKMTNIIDKSVPPILLDESVSMRAAQSSDSNTATNLTKMANIIDKSVSPILLDESVSMRAITSEVCIKYVGTTLCISTEPSNILISEAIGGCLYVRGNIVVQCDSQACQDSVVVDFALQSGDTVIRTDIHETYTYTRDPTDTFLIPIKINNVSLDGLVDVVITSPVDGDFLVWENNAWINKTIAGIDPTDHGGLEGLGDDDHIQYHNNTRGDIRYTLKGVDNSIPVTLIGTGTYLSLIGQELTVAPLTESDIVDLDKYTQAELDSALADKSNIAHNHTVSELSDTAITSPQEGQVLTWEIDSWKNQEPTGGTPNGGEVDQILRKNSNTDGDASWKDLVTDGGIF